MYIYIYIYTYVYITGPWSRSRIYNGVLEPHIWQLQQYQTQSGGIFKETNKSRTW